ncbi:MAG: chitobiase/beta-hexosaminidase C-terminal domain-containing protein [Desulfatitalea sp.]
MSPIGRTWKLSLSVMMLCLIWACGGGDDDSDASPTNPATATTAAPFFNPPGGTYPDDIQVSIASATADAVIYYTTNGETPSSTSARYVAPIPVSGDGTSLSIAAVAVKDGLSNSDIVRASYTIDASAPAAGNCANPRPEWLLCEDFEAGNGDFDAWYATTDFLSGQGTEDRGRMTIAADIVHSGRHALYMSAAAASGYEGAGLDWWACDGNQTTNCPLRGFDQLYFSAWVRFAEDHRYIHHFLAIAGSQSNDFWYHGTAGCLPDGALAMGTTVDYRENSRESFFYTYFPEMVCDTRCERYADVDQICQDCLGKGLPTCTVQPQCCWGNIFEPAPPVTFPVGAWFRLEMMMKANTPGQHDGEMAYWINGVMAHHVTGMMWRISPTLMINRVRLQHYITPSDAQGHSNRVWFDDVVVSTQPIGG